MTTSRCRGPLPALLPSVVALVAVVACLSGAPAVRASDVYGDDERDRYVGTGGLVLPGSIDPATRVLVASCPDCHWRLTTPCFRSSAGMPFGGQSPCLSTSRGCGRGEQLLRAWFRQGAVPWRQIGLVCIGEAPVTVAGAGSEVRDRLVRDLEPPVPRRQPVTGVVTQIPVIFDSGQAGRAFRAEFTLAGERVSLAASPAWHWEFGDGATLATADPGGAFPHDAVAHAYRRSGSYRVLMTTVWSASFTVSGLGPFDVPEPVRQESSLTLPVGEGRAVLAVR